MSKNFKGNEIDLDGGSGSGVVTLTCKWTCNSPEDAEEMHHTILSTLLDGGVVGIYKSKVLHFSTEAFRSGLLTKEDT